MTNRADRYFPDPYGLLDMDDFKNRLFPQLQAYHREQDFRLRYKGRQFPANRNRFTLGGHESELGCINILFLKLDRGWVLDKIFICR
jgi:hypothetical protein